MRGDNKLKAYYFFILSLSVIHRAILISMPPKKLSPQKISPQKASVQKGSPQETSSSNDMIILIYIFNYKVRPEKIKILFVLKKRK